MNYFFVRVSRMFLVVGIFFFLFSSNAFATVAGRCSSFGLDQVDNHFGCRLDSGFGASAPRWSYDPTDDYLCLDGYDVNQTVCSGTAPVCGEGNNNCCVPCVSVAGDFVGHGGSCANGEICSTNDLLECRGDVCLRRVAAVSEGGTCIENSECGNSQGRPLVCENSRCTLPFTEFDACESDTQCQEETGSPRAICNPVSGACVVSNCSSDEQCRQELGNPLGQCNTATGDCTLAQEFREEDPIGEFSYCDQVPDNIQRTNCERCYVEASETEGRVYTALGCIRTGGRGLTEDLVRVLMGVSGGIALLSILAGAFLYTVSRGDSTKVKEVKSLITAAVSGLFFIIFSIFILQFFGVSILRIPGLGGSAQNSSVPASNQASCVTEGTSASGGKTCCSGLVASGPNQMCRQPQFVVNGGFYLFEDDQSTQFCTSSEDAEYIDAVSLTSADVSCVTALNGITCGSFSSVPVPTTLGQAQTRAGSLYRCTGSVEIVSSVQSAFSQYLANTLGAGNSAFYRIYVEERTIGSIRYYDVNMMIEPAFWNTLPQSVRDEITRGPQLQLGYNATWSGTIEGESVERSTSYSGYATLLVQVVSFSNG